MDWTRDYCQPQLFSLCGHGSMWFRDLRGPIKSVICSAISTQFHSLSLYFVNFLGFMVICEESPNIYILNHNKCDVMKEFRRLNRTKIHDIRSGNMLMNGIQFYWWPTEENLSISFGLLNFALVSLVGGWMDREVEKVVVQVFASRCEFECINFRGQGGWMEGRLATWWRH